MEHQDWMSDGMQAAVSMCSVRCRAYVGAPNAAETVGGQESRSWQLQVAWSLEDFSLSLSHTHTHTHTHTSLPQAKRRALGVGVLEEGSSSLNVSFWNLSPSFQLAHPASPTPPLGLGCLCSFLSHPGSLLSPLSPDEPGQELQKEHQKNQGKTKGK